MPFTVTRFTGTGRGGHGPTVGAWRFAGRVAVRAAAQTAERLAALPRQVRDWHEARQASQRRRAAVRERKSRLEAEREAWFSARFDELTHPHLSPARLTAVAEEALRRTARSHHPALSLSQLRTAPWLREYAPRDLLSLYRQIATHPNAEPELLLVVCGLPGVADALLRNPVLPLLPLSSPEFFEQLPPEARWRLLSAPDCPPAVVALFQVGPDAPTADAARNHLLRAAPVPDASAEANAALRERLRRWVGEESPRIRALVVELHALGVLPEPFWDIAASARGGIDDGHDPLDELPMDEDTRRRCEEASDRATHLWTVRMLAGDAHPAVRRAACAHPLAPLSVREHARAAALRDALRSPGLALLLHLAEGNVAQTTPPDFPPVEAFGGLPPLRRLLYARQANPVEHRDLLDALAADGDVHVRAAARRFDGLGIRA
jgi:hypothetical protein